VRRFSQGPRTDISWISKVYSGGAKATSALVYNARTAQGKNIVHNCVKYWGTLSRIRFGPKDSYRGIVDR
jgi:hypothetical protein